MQKNQGWEKKLSKIVHKNKYFKVRYDKVIQPDGNEGEYHYIDNNNSVFVVAEDKNNRLILVGQSRYTANNVYSWEFVGGGIVKGDTPLKTAKKELKEEAGIIAQSWSRLGFFYPMNGLVNEKCFVFLAKDLQFGEMENESTEDIQMKRLSIKEIKKMIITEEIICGMTIATFYKYLMIF